MKAVQSMVEIITHPKIIRVKRDIIPITVLTKVRKEATAKVIIRIITMKKAVIKAVATMKLINTAHITRAVRDRRVESMVTKRDIKKARKQPDIITNLVKMITIRNTNSTMTLTKKAATINTAVIMHTTRLKAERVRKEVTTNPDTKEIVSAKRVTHPKAIMMMTTRDTKDTMDTKVISPIMTTTARRVDHLEVVNTVTAPAVVMEAVVVDMEAEVINNEITVIANLHQFFYCKEYSVFSVPFFKLFSYFQGGGGGHGGGGHGGGGGKHR